MTDKQKLYHYKRFARKMFKQCQDFIDSAEKWNKQTDDLQDIIRKNLKKDNGLKEIVKEMDLYTYKLVRMLGIK